MCKPDLEIEKYEAIKPFEFETLISLKHTWRSVANPNHNSHTVEVEFMNEVTLELLRVSFFKVLQFQTENDCHHIFPLMIRNIRDHQWDVDYHVDSEHGEIVFYCKSFSFIVIPGE